MGILSKMKSKRAEEKIVSREKKVLNEIDKAEEHILKHYINEFNEGFDDAYAKAIATDTDDEMFILFAKTLKGMKDYVNSEGISPTVLKSILRKSKFIDTVVKLCEERKKQ